MDEGLKGLLNEWQFIRHCSVCFISELSDADLDRSLPRKGLDTFRKHFEEMVGVERNYAAAIISRVMRFDGPADSDIAGGLARDQMLIAMRDVDNQLRDAVASVPAQATIRWSAEQRPLQQHLAALISHETLHIGQIIAFCYALGIAVPQFVRDEWALSGD